MLYKNKASKVTKSIIIGTYIILLVAATSDTVGKSADKSTELPSDTVADCLNLERIFSSHEFDIKKFGPVRWLEDCSGFTTLEDSEAPAGGKPPPSCNKSEDENPKDIVRYDLETRVREIIVPSTRLIPDGESKPLKIDDYSWSPDGKKLLIFTNTKRLWRKNNLGDYWVLDLTSWEFKKLGGDAEPAMLMFRSFHQKAIALLISAKETCTSRISRTFRSHN